MTDRKPVVLFLCSQNSCRSQMAEALLRHRGGDRFEAHSAGLTPAAIHPMAKRAMEEMGLSLEGHRPKGVEEYLGKLPVRFLITVCSGAAKACPSVWPGVMNREDWGIEDPATAEGSDQERMAVFRRVRDELDAKIQAWLAQQKR